jgi:hypothetical protein
MDPAELRLAFVDFNALLPNGLRIVTSSGAADTETESAIRETSADRLRLYQGMKQGLKNFLN